MAEPNNKPKTISFAGKDVDQSELIRRARQKAAEWAQYQGLKGDEVADFNESLNDILAGISDGRYTVTESGALSGKGSSQPGAYDTKTGQRVDANGGNSRRRRGFDPDSNVMGYLNGIAGALTKSSGTGSSASSSGKKAITASQYLSDQIFGEGNNFSAEQLIRWADAHDAVGADGKRGIEGRRNFINEQLGNYKQALLNGDYNITDEQRDKEIATIDEILGNNSANPDQDWQLSKIAPWMSHLLFRDAKYYSDESARTADTVSAEQKDRDAKAEAYRTGVDGATNPYEQGSEAYNLLEQRRNEYMDQAFLDEFRTHTWNYGDAGRSFRTQVTELEPNIFSSWNLNNVRDYLSGAEGLETNDYGQDVSVGLWGATEMGHNDYKGYGKGDTSLKGIGLNEYFRALPNDFRPDDSTLKVPFSGKFNARSNKAILGKAAADYARSIIGTSGGEQYQLSDGSYLLPQFVDWDSGKAYRFHLNGNKMTITTDNIGTIINGLIPGSPLYRTLLNEWRTHNQRPALTSAGLDALQYKEGGVLKAQSGAPLSQSEIARLTGASTRPSSTFSDPRYDTGYQSLSVTQSNANQKQLEADQARYAEALANGANKQRRIDEGNKTLSEGWSGVDIARAAAVVQDLGSIGAAFIPVYGTAAAGVLGLGSTFTTLGADIADKGVSTGQVLTGLGINLGMDIASLIPGINVSAGGMKVTKNIIKLAPKLIPAFTALATGPEAIETIKKITSGGGLGSVTKEELRNLSYCISAVSGGFHVGASSVKRAKMAKNAPKGTTTTVQKYQWKDSTGKPHDFKNPEAAAKAINEAGAKGQDAALAKLRELAKAEAGDLGESAEFANGENFKTGILSRLSKKAKVDETPTSTNNEEGYLKWLSDNRAREEAVRKKWIAEGNAENAGLVGKTKKFMAKNLSTDFEIMQGSQLLRGDSWKQYLPANPFIRGKGSTHGAYRNRITKEIAGTETKALEGLTPGSDAIVGTKVGERTTKLDNEYKAAIAKRNEFFKAENEAVTKARGEHKTATDNASTAESTLKSSLSKIRGLKEKGLARVEPVRKAGEAIEQQTALQKEVSELQAKVDKLSKSKAKDASKKLTKANEQLAAKNAELQAANESVRTLTQDKQAKQYLAALQAIRGHESAQGKLTTTKGNLKTAIENFRTKAKSDEAAKHVEAIRKISGKVTGPKAGEYTDYLGMAKITGATPNIKAKKEENFKSFIEFLKSKGQNDTQIKGILRDEAIMTEARNAFKFATGGIVKANVGVAIPAPAQKKPKPTAPITGTLGSGTGNSGPLSGTLGTPAAGSGNTASGTLGTNNPDVPGLINPSTFPGAPGSIGWGVNPTDLAITGLESGKYGLTQGINGAIYNIYAGFRGFHETPLLKHYRQWSAKPLEDQIAKNFAEYRRMGARAAAGTTDQNQAFSWQLASTDKAMTANQPLAIQANEQIKTTVDQQNAVGNDNFANMHEVGERNRQGDVALSNARLKAYADYLHKFGTTAAQNMTARQYGMAKAGILNDERSFQAAINVDPTVSAAKNNYNALLRRKALSGDTWTEADERALREAKLNYSEVATRFKDEWTASHVSTTGTPYAGYGVTYTAPAYFDFGSDLAFNFRSGGKMEAAEREKTRREYEKIYHDSMKLMVKESNKKLIAGRGAYAFYRKLFMHAK